MQCGIISCPVCGLSGHEFYIIPDGSTTPGTSFAAPLRTVGRHGIGRITFLEPAVISGTDLCDAVRFEHGLVDVAKDAETNCQINKPAAVVFENIWDLDLWYLERTENGTTTVIASSELDNVNGCLYDADHGTFQFTVSGFSKYKLRLGDRSSQSDQNSSSANDSLSCHNTAPASPWSAKPNMERGCSANAMATMNSPLSNFVVRNLANDLASVATCRDSTNTDTGDKSGRFDNTISRSEPENAVERTDRTGNDVLDGLPAFAKDHMNDAESDVLDTREPSTEIIDLFFPECVALCTISSQNGESILIPAAGREFFFDFVTGRLMKPPLKTQTEKELWAAVTLISVLWETEETPSNSETFFEADGPRIAQAFLSWIKEVLKEYPCNQHAVDEDLYSRVFHKLVDLNVNHAALIAKHRHDRALAELISAHRENRFHPVYQAVIHQLMTKNKASVPSIRKTLLLLSGRIFTEDLSVCENLDWLHCFAVCAHFAGVDEPQSLEALFCLYEDCCLYDAYCSGPSDDLTIGGPPRILYSIIRLFLGVGDFRFTEVTEFTHWNALYKWIFLCALKCAGLSLPAGLEGRADEDLITALVDWNKWEYAVALLLHQQSGKERNDRIRELIALNARTSLSDSSTVRFLTEKLAINKKWIFEAKVACELDEGNYVEAARLLLLLDKPEQAVDVLVNKLFLRWKRNGNFDESLFAVVENLEPYFSGEKSAERGDQLYKPLFEAVQTYYYLKMRAHQAEDLDGTEDCQLLKEKLKEDIERIRPLLAHSKVKCRDFVEILIEKSEQLVAQFQSTGIVDRLKGAFTSIFG